MNRIALLLIPLILVVAGCSARQTLAPVEQRSRLSGPPPAYYAVKPGDTLFSISFQHGYDFNRVARWNNIRDPYVIYPGQRIRLRPPRVAVSNARDNRAAKPAAPKSRSHSRTGVSSVERRAPPPRAMQQLAWRWPAQGRIVTHYSSRGSGRKGLDIAGRLGQPVVAAAPGRVVYAGSGLIGYGKLIIVKHNDTFLSAYAHNDRLFVKEGDQVRQGEKIAEMGRSGADRVQLHFEIRREGKPVDPLRYLPKRAAGRAG